MVGDGHSAPGHEERVERCFEALQEDGYGYLDHLSDSFDRLCGNSELCSQWADRLLGITRRVLGERTGYFAGTSACLACLYASGRYQDLKDLLSLQSFAWWSHDQWWAKALAAQDKIDGALEYAARYPESAAFCESLLLQHGRVQEAYQRFGRKLRSSTYLNSFREVCKRYPQLEKGKVLRDLIAETPGEEGKWFAAARSIGDLELALELAGNGPCAPSTLLTAVKDLRDKHPVMAFRIACAALRGLDLGWAYELDLALVGRADREARELAERLGLEAEFQQFRAGLRLLQAKR